MHSTNENKQLDSHANQCRLSLQVCGKRARGVRLTERACGGTTLERTTSPYVNLYRLRLIFASKHFPTYVPLVLILPPVPLWELGWHSAEMTNEEVWNLVRFSGLEIAKD
jgi:hypothetical protein